MGDGSLNGRVAVVTGASRGVGRATAAELARTGAKVVLAARDERALADAADATGGIPCVCDVSRPDDVDRLFETAGPVAVLVCAAGVLERATVEETTPELWVRTIAVNLTGTFLCCRRAFASMRRCGGGRIVTIASLGGVYGTEKFPGLSAYTASKHGVVGLTESIAAEGRDHGISAVCLSPGAVDTEMLRRAAPHLRAGLTPQDAARIIVALLDDRLVPLSGANIPVFSNR